MSATAAAGTILAVMIAAYAAAKAFKVSTDRKKPSFSSCSPCSCLFPER